MSSYLADQQAAAKIAGAIGDDMDEIVVGTVTKATSSTTAVVTHGLSGTPDFILASFAGSAGNVLAVAPSANSTSVTFTINTAQTTWSVSYIIGYTA